MSVSTLRSRKKDTKNGEVALDDQTGDSPLYQNSYIPFYDFGCLEILWPYSLISVFSVLRFKIAYFLRSSKMSILGHDAVAKLNKLAVMGERLSGFCYPFTLKKIWSKVA